MSGDGCVLVTHCVRVSISSSHRARGRARATAAVRLHNPPNNPPHTITKNGRSSCTRRAPTASTRAATSPIFSIEAMATAEAVAAAPEMTAVARSNRGRTRARGGERLERTAQSSRRSRGTRARQLPCAGLPSGRMLALRSDDQLVMLWRLAAAGDRLGSMPFARAAPRPTSRSGECVATLRASTAATSSASLAPTRAGSHRSRGGRGAVLGHGREWRERPAAQGARGPLRHAKSRA